MLRPAFLTTCWLLLALNANAQPWGNYTLYSIMNSQAAYLLNIDNTVYHSWTFNAANQTGYSTYLLPGGTLLRTVKYSPNPFAGGGQTGKLQKVAWDGTILWDFVYCTSTYAMHHDICPMPNGNVLLISYDLKTPAEVTQAGCSQSITIWAEKIVEVQQTGPTTGQVVWEWRVWDHLVQNLYPDKDNYHPSIVNNPQLLNINYKTAKDWMHMNGIDYNPILDQIVVSSHNLNEIYVIDHSTTTAQAAGHTGGNAGKGGDFLYRWGNPAAYQASGTAIFNIVHDSHWIPEGVPNSGRIAAFNNKGVSSTKSSVDQVQPPRTEYWYAHTAGTAYLPATYTQRHACNGYSSNMSSSQVLPNGNLFVCMAMSGLLYEVNPSGTTVWSKQVSGSVPKAYRYSACYVSNPPPPIPTIQSDGVTLTSSEAETYQWYRNGEAIFGATNQTYTPAQNGIYLVRTTYSSSCLYSYSTGYPFSINTSVSGLPIGKRIRVYPNPAGDVVYIDPVEHTATEVLLYSVSGTLLTIERNPSHIVLSPYPDGVYLLKINAGNESITHKLLINR